MIDFDYLYRGLCGLARAHRANTMAGHLGAAVVAGYFFGEDHPDLDGWVTGAIEKELDRIIAGEEAIWYNAKSAGITVAELFAPFPEERGDKGAVASLAEALDGNIGRLRQSGHNVIFAAIAIRALHDHPEYATPSIVGGIRKLITAFNPTGPGRGYYGKESGWHSADAKPEPNDGVPQFDSEETMAGVVIDELIAGASVHRRGFGGLFHVTNHAAALCELSRLGYGDLAKKGLPVHRHHVRLWQSLPDVSEEFGILKQAKHDPRTPEYWQGDGDSQWSAQLTHRVKTLYGFFTLLKLVEDGTKRKKAEAEFRYLMA